MSRRARRGRTGHAEETHVDERWLVSYADMITVLMCLFLVLFAMSTVDAAKYELLKNSLATGFGAVESDTVDTAKGVVVPEELIDSDGALFAPEKVAAKEVESLGELQTEIAAGLSLDGLSDTVEFTIDERGLTIRLVGSATFFDSNSSGLSTVAVRVLESMGPTLTASPYAVSVEGHADLRSSAFPFPTNWELSSGRATQVLRQLVERAGMPGERISAVGFGSSRPLAEGATADQLSLNRRVDVVVLSDQTEAVRALIPEIVAATS